MSAGRISGPTSNRNSTRIVYDESREIQKKIIINLEHPWVTEGQTELGFYFLMALVFWTKLNKKFSFNFVEPVNGCKLCEKN